LVIDAALVIALLIVVNAALGIGISDHFSGSTSSTPAFADNT
jgi:hypothetical protein